MSQNGGGLIEVPISLFVLKSLIDTYVKTLSPKPSPAKKSPSKPRKPSKAKPRAAAAAPKKRKPAKK